MKNSKLILLATLLLVAFGLLMIFSNKEEKTNGVFLLSENTGDISGYYKWEKELDERGYKAIIKPERAVLEENPEYFKALSDKGYEIATGYGQDPFWGMSYKDQFEIMKEYKEYAESVLQKPIKIFSSKYFAYDENTLKAADVLGIPYILARGTGLEAKIYSPKEYKAKLLFVSNLEFGEMGSGSLCDVSLYQRGAEADEFAQTLRETFESGLENAILVSHVYIGGTRLEWWNAYEEAIDSSNVEWVNFDKWAENVDEIKTEYKNIPYNTEVKYITPQPSVPLEDLELIPELKSKELIVFHNGQGSMCLEFLEAIEGSSLTIEEHLNTEEGFYPLLQSYIDSYRASQGVSNSFEYFPIIFIGDKAYSGFNKEIEREIFRE